MGGMTDWKHDGVRVIPAGSLDTNTAQTPGMNRAAAINFARVGAQKLWAGTVTIHAHAKTGAHHHGHLESVIYVVKGRARMRWGDQLEFVAEAGPGRLHLRAALRAAPGDQRLGRPSRWNACWCAPTTRRWRSTSTSSRPRSRKRSTGSIRPIRIRTSTDLSAGHPGAAPDLANQNSLGRQQYGLLDQRGGNDDAIERIARQVQEIRRSHRDICR